MNNYGGKYLNPICFTTYVKNNSIKNDFDKFWAENHEKFSEVIVEFEHRTNQKLFNNNKDFECNAIIKVTVDGLIGMKRPTSLNNDEDILNVMSNHINSFLSKLSMGGIHFAPIQYNQIEHLEINKNKLLLSRTIVNYKNYEDYTRNLFRDNNLCLTSEYYRNILFSHKNYNVTEFIDAFKNGDSVVKTFFKGSEYIFLEAYENYKQSKYSISLLLGWALIEIIISKYWEKNFENIVNILEENLFANKTKFIKSNERLRVKKKCVVVEKIKQLYKADKIDEILFYDLEKLRKTRNDLIHKGEVPNRENAGYVLVAIKKLVKIFVNIDMKFNNPGWSYHGTWKEN